MHKLTLCLLCPRHELDLTGRNQMANFIEISSVSKKGETMEIQRHDDGRESHT